ncbi:hypothetical protein C7B61_12880 [filamentous cyanobacterium CCP1]|nr:hypothetical protein C7B76_09245 [filamentous cyanobacterium CCP2]PSB63853.1 hypothetical protein C7B61_12880 [filamentous cyanobacterium CCP1]
MYPTLGVAILGSVPTWLKIPSAIENGIPLNQVEAARQRDSLFSANYATCLDSEDYDYTAQNGDMTVSTKLCPSGDVLIRFSKPDAKSVYQFVSSESVQRSAFSEFLIPAVAAATVSNKQPIAQSVICQKLEDGRLIRRIQEADGRCYEQIINTFTGEVISRTEVSCDADCE